MSKAEAENKTFKHRARKRFGQHFLVDQSVIDRIIAVIAAQRTDPIVEIGPGTGVLTRPLLEQLESLDVVELDRDLAANFRRLYSADILRVHETDVLNFSFRDLVRSDQANEKIRLIGNLPYNISSPLIFHILTQADVISDMIFMLQKEVAERITASVGSRQYGRLSVMIQYYCHYEYCFDVAPSAFEPPPKVMSSIIRLVPKSDPLALRDKNLFEKLLKQAFSQRRKTLHNTLKGLVDDQQLEAVGLSPQARAETISLEGFVDLANLLADACDD